MNSDMSHLEYKQYQSSQQSNPGLLRFRSAPGSLFANFSNGIVKCGGDACEIFSGHQSSSPEAQGLTSGFNSCGGDINSVTQGFHDLEEGKPLANGYSMSSQLTTHYQRQGSSTQLPSLDCNYGVATSVAMDHPAQTKMGTNLSRQSSSPAGLFSHLSVHNGYAAMRVVGNYRAGNGSNGEVSPSSGRLKGQTNFSSGVPPALGMLSRISEVESENIGASDHDDEKLRNDNGDAQFYGSGYSFNSWNDSSHFAENLSSLKRNLDGDGKLFSGTQDGELRNPTHLLSHHLSLPRTSAEMATMEKLLQFQDSVPCKIRAKRGCATHPRSIAERVRRTRISERMRKLQELVPSMDKQTNTADMLDLAVEYIKDLQKQYKTLSENRANCKCSSMQKPVPNQAV